MLSTEERFQVGLAHLKRLTRERIPQHIRSGQSLLQRKARSRKLKASPTGKGLPLNDGNHSSNRSLGRVLKQAGPFPPYSVLLGTCEDSLPLTFELTNPAPGAMLITGNSDSGKVRLLQAILTSTTQINNAEQVCIFLLTENPDNYIDLAHSVNCLEVLPYESTSTRDLIDALIETTEQRRRYGPEDPAIVLAIDDLYKTIDHLGEKRLADFHHFVRHGPRSRIWPIAVLSIEQVGLIHEKLLDAFRTRLIGRTSSPDDMYYLTGEESTPASELIPGQQFCIPTQDDWIRFWICD